MKIKTLCAVGLFLSLVSSPEARAFGMGVGTSGLLGSGRIADDYDSDCSSLVNAFCADDGNSTGFDANGFGTGLILDSNLAGKRLFNYRFSLAQNTIRWNVEKEVEGTNENLDARFRANGLVMDHAFGFGLVRNERLRLWLGPQFRAGVFMGRFEGDVYNRQTKKIEDGADTSDFFYFLAGVGPTLGLNLNFGETFTLALTGGARMNWVSGHVSGNDYDLGGNSTGHRDGVDFHGYFGEGFFGAAAMFRFGDSYDGSRQKR